MKKLNRDIFARIEEGLLYLYCLVFFINYDISKALVTPMILILIGRKVLYREKLSCGSDKLKKFFVILFNRGMYLELYGIF